MTATAANLLNITTVQEQQIIAGPGVPAAVVIEGRTIRHSKGAVFVLKLLRRPIFGWLRQIHPPLKVRELPINSTEGPNYRIGSGERTRPPEIDARGE
jgi:hypothetical protein